MEKTKRVLAMVGAIILVMMYVVTFITAITSSESSHSWFVASLGMTIFVPILLYACSIFIRIAEQNRAESRRREEAYMKMMREQLRKKQEEQKAEESNTSNQ